MARSEHAGKVFVAVDHCGEDLRVLVPVLLGTAAAVGGEHEVGALAQADVQEKNRIFDYTVTGLDPAQSAAWLKENRERWAQVIRRAGIMME